MQNILQVKEFTLSKLKSTLVLRPSKLNGSPFFAHNLASSLRSFKTMRLKDKPFLPYT